MTQGGRIKRRIWWKMDKEEKLKLNPRCIAGTMQAAVTNRGHLIPCCWLDDKNNLNHPIMKSLLKVSKISEVDDIEQIVFTKEWIEFEKNLKERNFDKILPTCKHQCQVREDKDKIKKEIFFDPKTGKMAWKNIR
jgi:hypothetical protein